MKNYSTSLLIICLFVHVFRPLHGQNTSATTYYVKADGGRGDGLSEASAWSFAFFNTKTLPSGTTVNFRRGDTFYGPINVQSGSSEQTTTYAAYGSGSNPVISGFKLANEWTYAGNSIYWTRLDVPELNVVTLDGKLQAMGRFPRTGYLPYNAPAGNQYITSALGIPFDPTGAEVVIRKIRQVTDRHRITSYRGNMIFLSPTGSYNTVYANNTSHQPQDGNGFFIQSSFRTLTQLGDWYYDRAAQRLYMNFSGSSPDRHQVKLASVPVLAQLNNIHHVRFQELAFEGANREVFNCNNGMAINLFNCDLRLSYGGIAADNGMNGLIIQGGSMSNLANSGLFVPQLGNNIVVDGTKLRNIGSIAGAGGSGDATQLGIWIQGERSTVSNCSLDSIGFHGIVLYGSNTLVEKNVINTFGLVKDDCGGIYEFQFKGVTNSNKIIRNNVILNGVGAVAGAPPYARYGQAAAIYLDSDVNHVQISNNTLAHGSWGGIMLAGVGTDNVITHNLTYNFAQGMLIHNFDGKPIRSLTLTDNKFVAKTVQQATMHLQMYANDDPAQYGAFSRNIYARPVDDNNTIVINREYAGGGGVKTLSLAAWQALYNKDNGSSKSVVTTGRDSNLRFDYNATDRESLVTLDNVYSDVSSAVKTSSIRLPAYGGSVMVKDVTNTINKTAECSATGAILYERWDNAPGVTIADIPLQNPPTSTRSLTTFEEPMNVADNYGSRIRGYICAPQTGNYTFWLASDDAGELWLSTDEKPANKVRVAYVEGSTGYREWTKNSSQKSVSIRLLAGQKYYIEALHKEGWGGDNLSVQWQLPDGTLETPLLGKYLSPYIAETQSDVPATCSATGTILYEQWNNVPGETVANIPVQNAPTSTAALISFEGPLNIADNYGSRIRGYVCVPQTGNYTFWLAGDDASELWLSSDESPANKIKLAYVEGWTSYREWTKYPSQKSTLIALQAGKKYYIEALHKEGAGGDHISVQWQLPNGTIESPLPGKYLAPYTATANGRLGQNEPIAADELNVFPNPFSSETHIEFTLQEAGAATVSLYNASGQFIQRLFNGRVNANEKNDLTTNADQLPSGVYLIRLVSPKNVVVKKAVLTR